MRITFDMSLRQARLLRGALRLFVLMAGEMKAYDREYIINEGSEMYKQLDHTIKVIERTFNNGKDTNTAP